MAKKQTQTRYHRYADIVLPEKRADEDDDSPRMEFDIKLSSTEPVRRWYGNEVLGHEADDIDLTRINTDTGAALLMNHENDIRAQLGKITKGEVKDGKYLMVRARLDPDVKGIKRIAKRIQSGFLNKVSVGYDILEVRKENKETDTRTFRWMPVEGSIVSVPADDTVGVRKQLALENAEDRQEPLTWQEINIMPVEKKDDERSPSADTQIASAQRGTNSSTAQAADEMRIAGLQAVVKDCTDLRGFASMKGEEMIRQGGNAADLENAIKTEKKRIFDEKAAENVARGYPSGATGNGEPGNITEQDARKFSQLRALVAIEDKQFGRKPETGEFEMELMEDANNRVLADNARVTRSGFTVPQSILMHSHRFTRREAEDGARTIQKMREKRILLGGSGTVGDNLVGEILDAGEFIPMLRDPTELLGRIRQIPIAAGKLLLPRQTGQITAHWRGENTAKTASDMAYDQVSLEPNDLTAMTSWTRQAALLATPALETMWRTDIGWAFGNAEETAMLFGTGSGDNQPLGATAAGVIPAGNRLAPSTGGSPFDRDDIINCEKQVVNSKAPLRNAIVVVNGSVFGLGRKAAVGTTGTFLFENMMADRTYEVVLSHQIGNKVTSTTNFAGGTDKSVMFFGSFSNSVVRGIWGGLDLIANPYTGQGSGVITYSAAIFVDVAFRYPQGLVLVAPIDVS